MGSLAVRAAKSVFWVASARLFCQAASWIATLFLIRILSPSDYGLMSLGMAYQALIVIIYDLGIGEAIVQKSELSDKDIDSAFWFSVGFGLILFGITWIMAELWARFFNTPELTNIIRALAIGMVFLSVKEVPYNVMARNLEFKKRSLAEATSAVMCLAVSLLLAIRGFGVWSLVVGQIVQSLVVTVMVMYFAVWKPSLRFRMDCCVRLLKFGLPITAHYILTYFQQKSDSIIVGRMLGEETLGYYTVAIDIARIPIDRGVAIANKVAYPVFSEVQNDIGEMQKYFYKLVVLVSLFCFPLLLGLFAVSRDVIVLVLSDKWLPSLVALRVFCWLAILQCFTGIFLIVLKARGNTNSILKFSILGAILLPFSFLVGAKYGINGVCLAWGAAYPVIFIYLLQKVCIEIDSNVRRFVIKTAPALLAGLVMLGLVVVCDIVLLNSGEPSFFGLALKICCGAIAYCSSLFLFSREMVSELREVARAVFS